jgi:pantoate--beta-alanine ligase
MEIYNSKLLLQQRLNKARDGGASIGFVPTMGALHEGHFSLIRSAKGQNNIVVVSIFVNPTQFNDANDYNKYPRDISDDIRKLKGLLDQGDIVFAPSEAEMYPEKDNSVFDFGYLDTIMEGKHRPGHFKGVAQIVNKLLSLVMPDKAYFGEKDYQQLIIIKDIVRQMQLPVEIVPCSIVREISGLALSSRNKLLTPKQKDSAKEIYKTLIHAKMLAEQYTVEELKQWVVDNINSNPLMNIEYFDIVDDKTLKSVNDWNENNKKIGCIAVMLDNIRLIDNIRF